MNRADFKVLAIDASGKTAGVCLLDGGGVIFQRTLDEGLTHSETLLPLVIEALAAWGCSTGAPALEKISLLAATAGPGSFTGLRIALALIKGMAAPGNIPAAGVSTLHALAAAAKLAGLRGTVAAALDARRNEVYWAAFDTRGAVFRITQDAAGPVCEMAPLIARWAPPVFFVGSGAEMCYNAFKDCRGVRRHCMAAPPAIAAGAAVLAKDIWMRRGGQTEFAALGGAECQAAGFGSAAGLRPVYLRLSQAQRERCAKVAALGGLP